MCLILVGWRVHPRYPLVVAANRDEFYDRPTQALARWHDNPGIVGGRDLEAGGTWLGMMESGRFAAVTNVREPGIPPGRLSRGLLTTEFLRGSLPAIDFARQIDCAAYSGFNLLLSDGAALVYCSNRADEPRPLPPGVYGLSNHRLDSPWPKLQSARQRFIASLPTLPATSLFFDLLSDDTIAADEFLPDTGVSLEWERLLSAVFVKSPRYGTRASTLLICDESNNFTIHERSFGPGGYPTQSSVISTEV